MTAKSVLPVSVVGCNLYTEMARVADCVQPASYWARCDPEADGKCAGGWKLLPGGGGRATPFFPRAGDAAPPRTYGAALVAPAAADLPAGRRARLALSRQFVAAQLNFLSGAALPTAELQNAYDAAARLLAATGEDADLGEEQGRAAEAQAALLARFNNGALPERYGAPAKCAA